MAAIGRISHKSDGNINDENFKNRETERPRVTIHSTKRNDWVSHAKASKVKAISKNGFNIFRNK